MSIADITSVKVFRRGTQRTVPPEETLAGLMPLMPVMGITRVADVTGLDCIGVPVAMAYRPNARSLAVSPGKGINLIAAKVSALMEAIEGWHAERILTPLLLASFNELRFERTLADIAGLPRCATTPFDSNLRILWIEGRNMFDASSIWMPFELVHTNYTYPLPPHSGVLLASSNGLASGNHMTEAMCHAVCEVIERDAATLWRVLDSEGRRQTRVALDTVDDTHCAEVLERFAAADMEVACWEMTSDIGVPVFRCAIADAQSSSFRTTVPGLGSGCHPSRSIALLRALTEAAQTRLTLITGTRDDMGVARHALANDRERHQRLLVAMRQPGTTRSFALAPTFDANTFDEDLTWLFDRLRSIGIKQVVAVDLTKTGIGIPVVRIVIPGLEGIDEAPGYVGGTRYEQHLARGQR